MDVKLIEKIKKTGFIQESKGLAAPEWLGQCTRVGGITDPYGDVGYEYCAGEFSGTVEKAIENIGEPAGLTTSIIMKESIGEAVAEMIRKCKYNLSILSQPAEKIRADPLFYEKITRICDFLMTSDDTDDETSLEAGEGVTLETFAVTSPKHKVIIRPVVGARRGSTLTALAINAVASCRGPKCKDEDSIATGCIFKAIVDGDGSVTPPQLLSNQTDGSDDAPGWTAASIGALTATDSGDDIDCYGDLIVVVNTTGASIAVSVDDGTNWVEVTSTDLTANPPNAVKIKNSRSIIIVGAAGYVFKSDDRGATVETKDAGVATASALNDVDFAAGDDVWVAVGDANAIIRSTNDGESWATITGPAAKAAVIINAVQVIDRWEWIIGYADGDVYYTRDGGVTWAVAIINAATVGSVEAFDWCDCGVLYMVAIDDSGNGIVLRNVWNGYTNLWEQVDVPTTADLSGIACCEANVAVAVGDVEGGFGVIDQILVSAFD